MRTLVLDGPFFSKARSARGFDAAGSRGGDPAEVEYAAGLVAVQDATGRAIATLRMNGERGQLLFDTRALAQGMYNVVYSLDGQVKNIDKLVVQ